MACSTKTEHYLFSIFSLLALAPPSFLRACHFYTIKNFRSDALCKATPKIIVNPSMNIQLGPNANILAIWFIIIVHIPAMISLCEYLTQHLVSPRSNPVSFLQLLMLPIPNQNDISLLSNLHQWWALKIPLHLLVPLLPASEVLMP